MVKVYTIALVIVIAAIYGLQILGGDGLPFDAGDVECIRFKYSYEDSTQVVVREAKQVAALMSMLRVKPKGPCLCAHSAEVVLVISGEDHTASVCGHCFNFGGKYHGYLTMPEGFSSMMAAYRDSARLREPLIESGFAGRDRR